MHTLVFFSIVVAAASDVSLEKQGECLVDSGEGVSDLLDSAMFVWGATQRCGRPGEDTKCEIDITSAIESANSMINVILKAVDKCGKLDIEHPKCGRAASRLTKSFAGLAAASGGLAQKCPEKAVGHAEEWNHASDALCVVNLKNTAKSLFKVIKSLMKVDNHCETEREGKQGRKCVSNALEIVAAFAGLGEYLAGVVGQCSHLHASQFTQTEGHLVTNEGHQSPLSSNDLRTALCSQQVSMLIHHLAKVAEAGTDLSKECEEGGHEVVKEEVPVPAQGVYTTAGPPASAEQFQRLYESDDESKVRTPVNSANLVLGAFLPVTALVSFVGGHLYANRRSRMELSRNFMSDSE